MMAVLLRWLAGPLANTLTGVLALLLGLGLVWQSARIEGWPFFGGGLKDQIIALKADATARDLADAKARAAALQARAQWRAAAEVQARAHMAAAAATGRQIRTIVEKVPVYVSAKSDSACVVPWGAVRLLDAAASGAALDTVRAAVAPARPDDAPSDVTLSEAVALLAENLGAARANADQLARLRKAVTP